MIIVFCCKFHLSNKFFWFALFIQLHSCELILEHEGVYGYVTVEEFPLDFVTLDVDILSLESPKFFRSFYLVSVRQHYFLI